MPTPATIHESRVVTGETPAIPNGQSSPLCSTTEPVLEGQDRELKVEGPAGPILIEPLSPTQGIATQEDPYLTMQAPAKSVMEKPMSASQVKREIEKIDAACATAAKEGASGAAASTAGTDNDTVRSLPSKTAKVEKIGGA